MRDFELSKDRVANEPSDFSMSSLVRLHAEIVLADLPLYKVDTSLCLPSIASLDEESACELHCDGGHLQEVKEDQYVVLRFEFGLRLYHLQNHIHVRKLLLC